MHANLSLPFNKIDICLTLYQYVFSFRTYYSRQLEKVSSSFPSPFPFQRV